MPGSSRVDEVVATEPLAGRARHARIAIMVQLVATVVSLGVVWTDRSAVVDLRDGFTVSQERIDSIERLAVVSLIFSFITLVVAAVFFLRWFSRAYKNVAQWTTTRHRTGWAVGAWFVPFLNLWRPYKIAEEIAVASAGGGRAGAPPMMKIWWALLMTSSLIDRIVISRRPDSLDAVLTNADFELLSLGLWLAAGVAATAVIRDVTADHERRRALAGHLQSPAANPPRASRP